MKFEKKKLCQLYKQNLTFSTWLSFNLEMKFTYTHFLFEPYIYLPIHCKFLHWITRTFFQKYPQKTVKIRHNFKKKNILKFKKYKINFPILIKKFMKRIRDNSSKVHQNPSPNHNTTIILSWKCTTFWLFLF